MCERDERQIVGREFVISGRGTPTLFDLAEAFDQVPRPIHTRAAANRVFAISFRRSHGVNLARLAPSPHVLMIVVRDAGPVLVHANGRLNTFKPMPSTGKTGQPAFPR